MPLPLGTNVPASNTPAGASFIEWLLPDGRDSAVAPSAVACVWHYGPNEHCLDPPVPRMEAGGAFSSPVSAPSIAAARKRDFRNGCRAHTLRPFGSSDVYYYLCLAPPRAGLFCCGRLRRIGSGPVIDWACTLLHSALPHANPPRRLCPHRRRGYFVPVLSWRAC